MSLYVDSETSRLRRILLHAPGEEVERGLPWPIRHPAAVRSQLWSWRDVIVEYEAFARAIQASVGDEGVLWLRPLIAALVEDRPSRRHFISEFLEDGAAMDRYTEALRQSGRDLDDLEPSELVEHLIGGYPPSWRWLGDGSTPPLFPLRTLAWLRDSAVVIGDHVVIATPAQLHRRAEARLLRLVFTYHPAFSTAGRIELDRVPFRSSCHEVVYFEGGNVLVLSDEVLVIGFGDARDRFSNRTTLAAIAALADRLFETSEAVQRLYAVRLPDLPGFIHLDTALAFTGPRAAVAMPYLFGEPSPWSLIAPALEEFLKGSEAEREGWPATPLGEAGRVLCYERGVPKPKDCGASLLRLLAAEGLLNLDNVAWVGGGGTDTGSPFDDLCAALWEQRQLAANVFAVAPFHVLGFGRSPGTRTTLQRHLKQDGRGHLVEVTGRELVKAGGGPRCLTLPLARDAR